MVDGFSISNKFEDMDLQLIHETLSNTYWAKGIPFDIVKSSLKNSLCFGVFSETDEQVAFARMITDYATFAYLADVFVVEGYRNKGIGKWLMQNIMQHEKLQGLRRISLVTKDAQGLYQQFGFKQLSNPQGHMEILIADIYSNSQK